MRGARGVALGAAAAVFALALGLILGSGPLRDLVLGDSGAQADALRREIAERDARIAAVTDERDALARYQDALTPALIAGRLKALPVLLVLDADLAPEHVEALLAAVDSAGAQIVTTVTLTPTWHDPDQAVFRAALADELSGEIYEPPAGASTQQLLHVALLQAVVPSAAKPPAPVDGLVDPDAVSTQSQVLRDVLERAGLVSISAALPDEDAPALEPAAVIIVTAQGEASFVAWGAMFRTAGLATVVTTFAPPDRALVEAAEADPAAGAVSVVADAASAAGRAVLVLAVEEQTAGRSGIYGDLQHSPFAPSP